MIIYSEFRELYYYYKLKNLISPMINTIVNTIQFPTSITISMVNATTINFYSTLTWIIPPNYTGIYHDFSAVLWLPGLNFGNWYRWYGKLFAWYGKVNTRVTVFGNTTGTINLYRLTINPSNNSTSIFTITVWTGTINNSLIISYSDNQPVWYGAFAYYFNLTNTITAVIEYNFYSSGVSAIMQIPLVIQPITTITALLGEVPYIFTYSTTQNQTISLSSVVITSNTLQVIAPFYTTYSVSLSLLKNGPYINWKTSDVLYLYGAYVPWTTRASITSSISNLVIYA